MNEEKCIKLASIYCKTDLYLLPSHLLNNKTFMLYIIKYDVEKYDSKYNYFKNNKIFLIDLIKILDKVDRFILFTKISDKHIPFLIREYIKYIPSICFSYSNFLKYMLDDIKKYYDFFLYKIKESYLPNMKELFNLEKDNSILFFRAKYTNYGNFSKHKFKNRIILNTMVSYRAILNYNKINYNKINSNKHLILCKFLNTKNKNEDFKIYDFILEKDCNENFVTYCVTKYNFYPNKSFIKTNDIRLSLQKLRVNQLIDGILVSKKNNFLKTYPDRKDFVMITLKNKIYNKKLPSKFFWKKKYTRKLLISEGHYNLEYLDKIKNMKKNIILNHHDSFYLNHNNESLNLCNDITYIFKFLTHDAGFYHIINLKYKFDKKLINKLLYYNNNLIERIKNTKIGKIIKIKNYVKNINTLKYLDFKEEEDYYILKSILNDHKNSSNINNGKVIYTLERFLFENFKNKRVVLEILKNCKLTYYSLLRLDDDYEMIYHFIKNNGIYNNLNKDKNKDKDNIIKYLPKNLIDKYVECDFNKDKFLESIWKEI